MVLEGQKFYFNFFSPNTKKLMQTPTGTLLEIYQEYRRNGGLEEYENVTVADILAVAYEARHDWRDFAPTN